MRLQMRCREHAGAPGARDERWAKMSIASPALRTVNARSGCLTVRFFGASSISNARKIAD
jgi:hypothetical protein